MGRLYHSRALSLYSIVPKLHLYFVSMDTMQQMGTICMGWITISVTINSVNETKKSSWIKRIFVFSQCQPRRVFKDWCAGRTPPTKSGRKNKSPQVSPNNIFALLCMAFNSINAPFKLKSWILPCSLYVHVERNEF